jgi:hypothetical protein
MGRIKSALEIALERTETVKTDKGSIDQYESRQRGKRLANAVLENPEEFNLEGELKKTPTEQLQALKQGIFDILISQIALPLVKEDEKRIAAAGKGLQVIINDPHFAAMYKHFLQAIGQYLDEAVNYSEALQRQYAPKLRKKEEEMSRRYGRQVKVDPLQDPEFIAFYNQNINALKDNYQALVDQIREQAQQLWKEKE